MDVRELTDPKDLTAFVGSQEHAQFLQSWQWGEFQHEHGRPVVRLGVLDGPKLVGAVTIVTYPLSFGKHYLYCPRGPVVDEKLPPAEYEQAWLLLLAELVRRGRIAASLFIKIEPAATMARQELIQEMLCAFPSRHVDFVQPQDSWLINLNVAEKELLQRMHHKTRYNVALAERKGVTVRISEDITDLNHFWKLNVETTTRDRFHSHPHGYYRHMFDTLVPSGFMRLFLAEHGNETLAASLVMFYGDTVTYVHGASSNKERNLMAPHLLQWRAIQLARKERFRFYDFWGVAPASPRLSEAMAGRPAQANATHSWSGITRFKKGFGGDGISYVGAYDLILDNSWYTLYKLAQTMTRRVQ